MSENGDRKTPTRAITVHRGREPEETQLDRIERGLGECFEYVGTVARDVSLGRADLDMLRVEVRRIGDSVALLHGARSSDVPPESVSVPPPSAQARPRERLPSLVDESKLEILPPTLDGQMRYGMTSGYMRSVINESVAAKVGTAVGSAVQSALAQKELESAAAPVLFVRGKFIPALLLSLAGLMGGGLWALISKFWH
jgi:hypothetical protein